MFNLLLLSLIIYGASSEKVPALHAASVNTATIAQRRTQSAGQRNTRVANNFPGSDLGAKINAADKDLGTAIGEIVVRDGGTISTQVVISSGHTLRFGPGTYKLMTELLWEGVFLLKSRTTVVGSGWETIIVEPPKTGWTVFQSYEDMRTQPVHSGTDSDISVSNLQIRGANPKTDGSVRQTLGLGNCHRCTVERVWLNGTGVIGIQAGGISSGGNFADTVTIKNNLFTQVAGQGIAVSNGRNIVIDGNTFKESGRLSPAGGVGMQGMTAIDVEPNSNTDIAQRIEITNNVIDSSNSSFQHGNGIVVQNGELTRNFGPVLVKGNTVIGGNLIPNLAGYISTGIYVAAQTQDVTVIDNTVRRVAHCGIRLENSTRINVARNKLISTGTGGLMALEVTNTTNSQIVDNLVAVDPNSPAGNSVIQESGTSKNNLYRGNTNGATAIAPTILSRQ